MARKNLATFIRDGTKLENSVHVAYIIIKAAQSLNRVVWSKLLWFME